jgi:hypothetical protein
MEINVGAGGSVVENHVFATINNYYHWTEEISIGTITSG